MTRILNSLMTIGWIIEGLTKLKVGSPPGLAILDYADNLEPIDYFYIYDNFRPIILCKENPRPQAFNVIIADNVNTLMELAAGGKFFKHSKTYIYVTAINNGEIITHFNDISTSFGAREFIVINYDTAEIMLYGPQADSINIFTANASGTVFLPKLAKIPNFGRRSLRIVYFRREESFVVDDEQNMIGGQDAIAMKTITALFNATAQLVETSDGRRYGQKEPNGTATGTFNDLLQGTADIAGNTHFLKFYGVSGLHFTHYLGVDRLCLLVPKPRKIPNYVALFENVRYEWLFLYMASSFVGLMTVYRMGNLLGSQKKDMSTSTLISMVFMIFLGVPVVYHFSKLHERVVVSSLLLATVVISNYFQCIMTTIASTPSYQKTLNTLADVRDAGIEIVYSNHEVKSYLSNEDLKGLNFKQVSVNESKAAASRSDIGRTHRTYSVFTKKNVFYKGMKTSKKMYIVNECLVDYPLAFVVPEEWPFLEPTNRILERMVESGLYKKWTKDSVPPHAYTQKTKESTLPEPLRNDELYFAYALLGVGQTLSFVVFLVENIIFWKSKNRTGHRTKSNVPFRFVK